MQSWQIIHPIVNSKTKCCQQSAHRLLVKERIFFQVDIALNRTNVGLAIAKNRCAQVDRKMIVAVFMRIAMLGSIVE
jgi:hypothetical protein